MFLHKNEFSGKAPTMFYIKCKSIIRLIQLEDFCFRNGLNSSTHSLRNISLVKKGI